MALPHHRSILHREFLKSTVELLAPKEVVAFKPHTPICDVLHALKERKIGSVLVRNETEQIAGIFTERDAIYRCALSERRLGDTVLEEVMTKTVVTLPHTASIARLLYSMVIEKIRHMPITGPAAATFRILSIKDIIYFLHDRLTKKIVESKPVVLSEEFKVDRFFESDISILTPEPPISVHQGTSLRAALKLLAHHKIGSIIVDNDKQLVVGIFTERDYVTKVATTGISLDATTVGEVMSDRPQTAQPQMSIAFSLNLMCEGGYRHLPIVNEYEKLVGILSIKNFLTYLAHSIVEDLDSIEKHKPRD